MKIGMSLMILVKLLLDIQSELSIKLHFPTYIIIDQEK